VKILDKVSFKYKLSIPLLFTVGIFGLFLMQNHRLSNAIENQLLSMHKQEIWLSNSTQAISYDITDLKSGFISKALLDAVDEKVLSKTEKKFEKINAQIEQIIERGFSQDVQIKQSLVNLKARLQGYYAILLDLPEAYKESPEDAIYTMISLQSVSLKIEDELTLLMAASKAQLSQKITTIQNLATDNMSNMIWTSTIYMSLLILLSLLMMRQVLKSIDTIKRVNKSFSEFLHKRVDKVEQIIDFPNDKIGEILHIVDDNMTQAEILISKDREQAQEIKLLNDSLEARVQNAIVEITSLNTEIEDTQREVIFTMGAIGESRSKETGNHVKRVAEYSKLLAILYGLDEEEANLIKEASPMHDIGKVGIPDYILNKPGKLTSAEFTIMKTHAQIGYEMLKHSKRTILKTAAIVAYEHHEKYNGRGYPRGLKGDEIHIYGAITAVVDVFDALGSDRVYKKAWSMDRILDLFEEEKGEHFHPVLTQLLLDNIDKFIVIKEQYMDVEEEEIAY
jgi:response regulator RpfG family c-di-GMP phosphodiesterase